MDETCYFVDDLSIISMFCSMAIWKNQKRINDVQCRTKDMGSISTPTMLLYMNFPEPNEIYNKQLCNRNKVTLNKKEQTRTKSYGLWV